jgi:transcription factor SOX1/3/14/21 (SOX group B)
VVGVFCVAGMAASQMGQVGSYYNPAAAAYGSLSAASMAAAAAAAAAQQSAISGLSAPAQVKTQNHPV